VTRRREPLGHGLAGVHPLDAVRECHDQESTTTLCVITLPRKGFVHAVGQEASGGTYPCRHLGGSTDFDGSTSVKESLMVAKATSKTALKLSNARVTYGDEGVEQLSVTVLAGSFTGSTRTGVSRSRSPRRRCV